MTKRNNSTVDIRGKDKSFADDFYTSWTWRKCKESYKVSIGGLCERCRAKGIIKPVDEVHHKIHLTPQNINNPEIALNWDNLIALCTDCHKEMHRKTKRWIVDEDGNVLPKDPP